jgi:ABC-2 type transport system ATP-binding protein
MDTIKAQPGPVLLQAKETGRYAISTEKLTKSYGSARGITKLDLQVREGEIFGFLGPNGAGKTTTIRLLMNLIKPTSGRASLYGLDCQADSVEIKKFTGYLPGEFTLYPNLSGAQTLKYFASLRGGVKWSYIAELAGRLELDLSRKFREYSHGNKQKIGIIQAMMHRPRLLIVDEPTNGLDPLNQQEFYKLIRELREHGSTIFMSSHIMSEVEDTCDRVGLIREGKLVRVGNMSELVDFKIHYLEVTFQEHVSPDIFKHLPGVDRVEVVNSDGTEVMRCVVRQENLGQVVKTVAQYPVLDFVSREPSLETIFLDYFGANSNHNGV